MESLSKARDIMNEYVEAITPNESASEAAKRMLEKDIGSILVVDNGKLVGIITKSDYIRAFIKSCRKEDLKVADIMSKPVITCSPETPISEIIHIMRLNGIRHIPVLDKNKLLGIVTDFDLACSATTYISKLLMILRPPKG